MKFYKWFGWVGLSALLVLSFTMPTMSQHSEIEGDFAKATFAGGCFWCMEPPFEALLPAVYDDVHPRLHRVAARSLGAHLEKLVAERRVRDEAGRFALAG